MQSTSTLKKIKPVHLFAAQFLVWAILGILGCTAGGHTFYKYLGAQNILIKIFCFTGILFNLFVYKTYNRRKIIIHSIISLIVLIVCVTIDNYRLSYLWFFLLSIGNISFKDITKVSLTVVAFMVTSIMTLTALGVLKNVTVYRSAYFMPRHGFGFFGPNIVSAYLFEICIATVYLRWKDFGIKDNLFLSCCCWFCVCCTNSKAAAILIFLLIIFTNFSKFIYKKDTSKIYYILANTTLALVPIISDIVTKMYCHSVPLAYALDEFFSCRFRNMCYSFAKFPVHLFGTKITITHDLLVIHNLNGYILLNYGIIIFVLFLIGYFLLIKKSYKAKNIPLLIILLLSIMQALTETRLLFPFINYTVLAFSALLNNSKLMDND